MSAQHLCLNATKFSGAATRAVTHSELLQQVWRLRVLGHTRVCVRVCACVGIPVVPTQSCRAAALLSRSKGVLFTTGSQVLGDLDELAGWEPPAGTG